MLIRLKWAESYSSCISDKDGTIDKFPDIHALLSRNIQIMSRPSNESYLLIPGESIHPKMITQGPELQICFRKLGRP